MSNKCPFDRIISEHESDQRTPYRHDRDRILYSKEFRRLSGVTQVARVGESPIYHDRLTHSLKVAQVASSLTDILINRLNSGNTKEINGYFEEKAKPNWNWKRSIRSLVKTAALAHDLGHPPFGHVAEKELNELVDEKDPSVSAKGMGSKDYGGFEGNAQSFRIVTKVARRRREYEIGEGLNLTLASLNALLKYPKDVSELNQEPYVGKWGYYPTEQETISELDDTFSNFGERSIEAEIMDYADDVTYAVHDMSDFYRAGLVPLHQLLIGTPERERFCRHATDETCATNQQVNSFFDRLKKQVADDSLETQFMSTDEQIAAINKFRSYLIRHFLTVNDPDDLTIEKGSNGLSLNKKNELQRDLNILKELTVFYVIDNSNLQAQQSGQVKIIRKLFQEFHQAIETDSEPKNLIPHPFRNRIKDCDTDREQTRIIVDLICSMTEQQAIDMYHRISGSTPGSLREGIME